VDVLACPCGGRLQLVAFMAEATAAKRILDHLGLDSHGPPLARAQAPPDLLDPAPAFDGVDHLTARAPDGLSGAERVGRARNVPIHSTPQGAALP
jgi:hypothetical protein